MASFAPPQAIQVVDVPLSLFAGLDTELAASDCPEGLSPDNQDVIFLAGEVESRPGLAGLYPAQTGAVNIVYHKSYIQPNGQALTLFLDSSGALYFENVINSPLTYTKIGNVKPGLYAQSASAFGREYIAISDLHHGQDVPLQFDGINLDRVTQDGPGAGPAVTNFAPASATVQGTGVPLTATIVASPNGIVWGGFTVIRVTINRLTGEETDYSIYKYFTVKTSAPHGFLVGESVTLAGSTSTPSLNGTFKIATVPSTTTFTVTKFTSTTGAANGGGGTATATASATSISRQGNIVTAVTTADHAFQAGWQVRISGVSNTTIGGGIAAISRSGAGIVTVTTTTAHGLPIGAQVVITGVTNPDTTFNGTFPVASVLSPTQFTYTQSGTAVTSGAGTGNVQDIWNTTAFIQSVPSSTTFTYQQTGPDDTTTNAGTATIVGQVSPGQHGVVVMFLTRQGAITAPSPPITVAANGAQQFAIDQLPIGPANVVARILGFTGAGGSNYFIIPATPQVSGQIVGTSTLIADNTTTSIVLDFSDTTLFDGIAIDQPGNDLFDQRVLGPVLGFFSYGSRLLTWGDFNKIENLLNPGFDGGYQGIASTLTAGSGANGSGSAWTNPANITSASSYAEVNMAAGLNSAALLAETFGFTNAGIQSSIVLTLQYYFTGSGGAQPAQLIVRLLKAGVPVGAQQSIQLQGSAGTSGAPLAASFTFTGTGLTAADVNDAGFGFQVILAAKTNSCDVFVRNGQLTASTIPPYPAGWATTGSTSVAGQLLPSVPAGFAYQMTSAGGLNDCMISQGVFEDSFGTSIILPNTGYQVRAKLSAQALLTGALVFELFSPSSGSLSIASFDVSDITSVAQFQGAVFSLPTPLIIPPDTLLRLYLQSVTNGGIVVVDEIEINPTLDPYNFSTLRASYVLNPEGFAQTTGNLGSDDDSSAIRCLSLQQNSVLLKTAEATHIFQGTDAEPENWTVSAVSHSVGCISLRGGDPGKFGIGDAAEDWDVSAHSTGIFIFAGARFFKISPEISRPSDKAQVGPQITWEDINPAARHTVWVKNDPGTRRIYIGAPIGTAMTPSHVFVMDYRGLDTAEDIAYAPGLKIGISGKMLSTDKSRKWARWNVAANSAEILVRPDGRRTLFFAGGNGQSLGAGPARANLYSLNPAQFTDDDYGQIFPYYCSYFAVNHEQEQQLGLGSNRKLFKKLSAFVTGIGQVSFIPFVNSLFSPLPRTKPIILTLDADPSNPLGSDLEWTLSIRAERVAFSIQVDPLPGTTDVKFNLQKLIFSIMREPVTLTRGPSI